MSSGPGHSPLPHSVSGHQDHGHPSTHPHSRCHSHSLLPQLAGVIVNSDSLTLCYCSDYSCLLGLVCGCPPGWPAEGRQFQEWPGEGWRPGSFLLLGSLYMASWELRIPVLRPEWGRRR